MNESAQQICARAQNGDPEAATALVTLHYQRVYAFLFRLSGDPTDASDLTQQAFARVWKSLSSFQQRSSVSTWIHGIAYHVYLDWRRQNRPSEERNEEWWKSCATDIASPVEEVATRDAANRLCALVEGLDEEVRETVHMHYYQGLSIRETADILGIATSTVKYRLRNALTLLKSQMNEARQTITPLKP